MSCGKLLRDHRRQFLDAGSRVRSGVYLCRVRWESGNRTTPMILMR